MARRRSETICYEEHCTTRMPDAGVGKRAVCQKGDERRHYGMTKGNRGKISERGYVVPSEEGKREKKKRLKTQVDVAKMHQVSMESTDNFLLLKMHIQPWTPEENESRKMKGKGAGQPEEKKFSKRRKMDEHQQKSVLDIMNIGTMKKGSGSRMFSMLFTGGCE
ncbi:hypothetical protein ASPZODRAFT_1212431 [Penicilliopsis zonata CBS 506.65]|uniref:Uncharacterized protein n=1 Tax=Penicilliopsis zonata CBS 506.65 TaxID=1073090 RepID=A0A1L9S7E1_9EURO|nr:hypothetical protein ASPZODRAFT_1212431 [Penicilliopsis zonata CBS 506.65]OJJ43076.1 hypothetical protein ASPZODRAFT_1212431 [Penicilliopsis zonata CBS 506.65]